MSEYKLTYFDGRGRAELSRWIMAAASQEYEDNRISFDTWNGGYKQTTPFGHLPILELDGAVIGQSTPIVRFLARRFGFAGSGDVEQARVDMVADYGNDLFSAYMDTLFNSDDGKAACKQGWDDLRDDMLSKLEKLLYSNGGGEGYFIGDSLTYADMSVAAALNMIGHTEWTSYPKLEAHKARVEGQEGIAKWLSVRRTTPW